MEMPAPNRMVLDQKAPLVARLTEAVKQVQIGWGKDLLHRPNGLILLAAYGEYRARRQPQDLLGDTA